MKGCPIHCPSGGQGLLAAGALVIAAGWLAAQVIAGLLAVALAVGLVALTVSVAYLVYVLRRESAYRRVPVSAAGRRAVPATRSHRELPARQPAPIEAMRIWQPGEYETAGKSRAAIERS
jgi:methyl coenzyme M reductase subunit C